MPFEYDAELAPIVAAIAANRPERGSDRDWRDIRSTTEAALTMLRSLTPPTPGVVATDHSVVAADGADLLLRWYVPAGSLPGSAVVYLHGGGMVAGSVELSEPKVTRLVADTGIPVLAVDYRLAPEHPHPTPLEDCVTGLRWLVAHASDLGVDPGRIAVMGESAGGGLAAGVALRSRDEGIALAKQVLLCAMLDDRTTDPDPALLPFASWTYDDNRVGWTALLGPSIGSDEVSPYAAPARATDLVGVADAYVEVGELDIFRDENVEYARRLARAGVSVELHVHPGAPHGFDLVAPDSALVRRARADRVRVLQEL